MEEVTILTMSFIGPEIKPKGIQHNLGFCIFKHSNHFHSLHNTFSALTLKILFLISFKLGFLCE
jgi:hypothetical protein